MSMTLPPVTYMDSELLTEAHSLVHVGTWLWDVPADKVVWSDELFRLFGLEPQSIELDLQTYLRHIHPKDAERVTRIIQSSMATGDPFEFEHRILRGGQVRILHCRGNVRQDTSGVVTRMLGTAMDVTERAKEQETLRVSEERFRSVFEQSAVGIAVTDAERRFVKVNASFAALVGRAPEELVGVTFSELTHPDDVPRMNALLREHEATSTSLTYEKRYLRPDGGVVWGRATVSRLHHDNGTPDGYLGVVEDITERKRATEQLERQTELLQNIMDHLPVMVSLFGPDGRPLYLNREWQRVLGWTLQEAQPIDLLASVYPDPQVRMRASSAILGGEASWEDFESRTRDGRPIPTCWACINLSDGTHLTIGKDNTERRAMEQRMVQSQRMEALGQLAGGVAHDFNNILTVITACASFVREAIEDRPEVMGDVKEIEAAARRAESLTRQLLAFSRRQMLKPEIFDVNVAVQTLSKTLTRLIGENIQLAIVANADPSNVEVDVHQLEQVLLNLVVNARDSIADNGTITIETSNLAARAPDEREHIVISVTDDGAGIPPQVRQRIFEPFFTTKPVGKGTGLGLATVLGIVDQSGGRVEVDSVVGRGTTFRVVLPLACASTLPRIADDAVGDLRGTQTILLVEDEASVRAIARRVLAGLGYQVIEARHGADAIQMSSSHAGPIHLLITDVVMPEMGGRDLARNIRRQRPGLPILYISGYTDDELLQRGILETGAQLLRKPFIPNELAKAAKDLIGGGQGKCR
jgi:two-component system cell cycle sensor histidine kinase/response regulator CckA